MHICQICLRKDLELKVIDTRLSDFHDELCDYAVSCSLDPRYCTICEHMLRKAYNFRAKCIVANKILNDPNRSKPFLELYKLLPPSSIGLWIAGTARIYECSYSGQQLPVLTIHGNVIDPTPTEDIKLEPNPTDLSEPNNSLKEESEVLLSINNGDKSFLELNDPLMNEDENKTEDIIDLEPLTNITGHETVNEVKIEFGNKSYKVNPQEIKSRNKFLEVDKHNSSQKCTDNVFQNDKREMSKAIESFDAGFLNEIDELLRITDISDDDTSLNSNDDCDSDDFILNDKVFHRRQKLKEKKQTPKVKEKTNSAVLLKHDNLCGDKSEPIKRSLLELTNISLSDADNEENEEKVTKKIVVKKGKITKRKNNDKLSKAIKDKATKMVDQFLGRIAKKRGKMYTKEKLLHKLMAKFKNCGDLKTDDGTVLDKESILFAIKHVNRSGDIRNLWKNVRGSSVLTKEILNQLKSIQNTNNEYLKVFDMLYLNTEEEMLEEFEKRKTYKAYLEAPYKCDYCHRGFIHKKLLEYHMKSHSEKMGDAVCPICKIRRREQRYLRAHINLHITVYKCKLCPVVTNYRSVMINHYQQHQGVQYKCDNCDGVYRSQSSYNSHRGKSCKGTSRLPCPRCALTCFNKSGLDVHTNLKHRGEPPVEENPDATCSTCSVTFASVDVYHKHMRITHNRADFRRKALEKRTRKARERAEKFVCRVCNVKGTTWGWLLSHFKTEHPNVDMSVMYLDKANHLCDICGKGYMHIIALRDHMNTHSEEPEFACDMCPKRFYSGHRLRNHKLYHGPPALKCKVCGKMFRAPSNLFCHMRTHIGDRRFKCHICGKGFLHATSVKEHIRGVHYNVKRVKKPVTRRTKGLQEDCS